MVFNSLSFALFLFIVFLVYWNIPHRYRWVLLLIANIFFYLSFDIRYILVLFFNIFISYLFAFKVKDNRKNLALAIVLCLMSLLLCKYLNFTVGILSDLGLKFNEMTFKIIQPVGISFYTFEIISYLVDVYRGKSEPERHLGYYAVYVSFFGTISSGPIERAGNFITQLKKEKKFIYEDGTYALKLFAWGLFKKIVIADNLAFYVDNIYGNLNEYRGFILVIIVFLYSIEIYCDFSGYSDMARAVAKLLGLEINVNFKSPYLSMTVKEFWGCWHISLTSWFRDYLYIPMGGNRKGKIRKYLNQFIVFFVSGLWHGANVTFVLWGVIHALLESLEDLLHIPTEKEKNLLYYARVLSTFVLVSFAWVFFRADSIQDALYVFGHLFSGAFNFKDYIVTGIYSLSTEPFVTLSGITACLIPLILFDYCNKKTGIFKEMEKWNVILRYVLYGLLIIAILFFHYTGEVNFIYFKF